MTRTSKLFKIVSSSIHHVWNFSSSRSCQTILPSSSFHCLIQETTPSWSRLVGMLCRPELHTRPRKTCNRWRWSVTLYISALYVVHIIVTDTGAQPLVSDDGKIILAVNGEIYNHIPLRASVGPGVKFKTNSDCEVIIPLVICLSHILFCFLNHRHSIKNTI